MCGGRRARRRAGKRLAGRAAEREGQRKVWEVIYRLLPPLFAEGKAGISKARKKKEEEEIRVAGGGMTFVLIVERPNGYIERGLFSPIAGSTKTHCLLSLMRN
jgi:hypothetical protein